MLTKTRSPKTNKTNKGEKLNTAGGDLSEIRQFSKSLFSSANSLIDKALSEDSSEFLKSSVQHGGE